MSISVVLDECLVEESRTRQKLRILPMARRKFSSGNTSVIAKNAEAQECTAFAYCYQRRRLHGDIDFFRTEFPGA